MNIRLEADTSPPQEMLEELQRALRVFNREHMPHEGPRGEYAVCARDESDAVVGGVWAAYYYDWMFVQWLSVPEVLRGQGFGREMMDKVETRARELGLAGIRLDTFAFQARGFYEKLGYEVFGTLEDHPRGSRRFFLRKYLTQQ